MSEKSTYDQKLVGLKGQRNPKFYVSDIEKLKERTQVGNTIKFKVNVMDQEGHFKWQNISGIVEAKYPHIFCMDGKYYRWVDYLIGYIY